MSPTHSLLKYRWSFRSCFSFYSENSRK